MLYMETFTINMTSMLAYIPYMDPMGYQHQPTGVFNTAEFKTGFSYIIHNNGQMMEQ